MRRTSIFACGISFALAACGSRQSDEATARFLAVHEAMRTLGLSSLGAAQRGTLAQGQFATHTLPSSVGCMTVAAFAPRDSVELRLDINLPNGSPVANGSSRQGQVILRACTDRPGALRAVVRVVRGAGDYIVATYRTADVRPDGDAGQVMGGTCDDPVPLLPGTTLVGSTRGAAAEHTGSCGASMGGERVYRLDVPTRQRVTIEVVAQFDSLLYLRKAICADDAAEIACNDDVPGASNRSRVQAVLDPAVYFVFVDSYDEAGGFRIKATMQDAPSLSAVCRDARPLASSARVQGSLATAFDNVHATCGRDAKGGDVAYLLELPARMRVRLTQHADDFHPILHVRSACESASSQVACADSAMNGDEVVWAGRLAPGAYTVFADSSDEDASGSFYVEADVAPEPSGPVGPGDDCGDALPIAAAAGLLDVDTFRAADGATPSCAGAGAPDLVYRLDLPRRARVAARIVGDETSHVLALATSCTSSELACGASIDKTVDPGAYFLVVDGRRPDAMGRLKIAYRVQDVAATSAACARALAIRVGATAIGTTVGAGDKFTPACGGRSAFKASSDRVYRLTLGRPTKIRLSLTTEGFRGVVSLRRTCGEDANEIACAEPGTDPVRAELVTTLDAGTYYAVVDGVGQGAEGPYTLGISEVVARGTKGR